MANKSVPQMSSLPTGLLSASDLLHVVRANVDYKLTYTNLLASLNADIPNQDLGSVLSEGNITSGNDIVFTNGDRLTSQDGGVVVKLSNSGVFEISDDNEAFNSAYLSMASGSIEFKSAGGDSGFSADTISSSLSWRNGTGDDGYFSVDVNSSNVYHTDAIAFSAPDYTFVTLTADRVPYIDSNSNLVVSSITPSELGQLTGATSPLQAQIDALVTGLSWKQAVRVATTGPGTLATSFESGDTIDGVVIATGDRILIKDQASATENGIYIVNNSGAPTRSTDMNAGSEFPSATVAVSEGTTNQDTQWVCNNDSPVTIGVTNIVFVAVGGTTYVGTSNRITVTGNVIDIAATYVGQSSITTLGTITTGTLGSGSKILLGSDATYDMYYNGGSGNITRFATANSSVLTTNGSGVPSWVSQDSAFNKAFGVSSGTVAQGDDSRFTHQYYWASASTTIINDSSSYRISAIPGIVLSTADSLNNEISSEVAGTVVSVRFNWNMTAGSNEGTTLRVKNLTTGSSWDASTTLDFSVGTGSVQFSGGTLGVSVGDKLQVIIVTPAYATNPFSLSCSASITIRK